MRHFFIYKFVFATEYKKPYEYTLAFIYESNLKIRVRVGADFFLFPKVDFNCFLYFKSHANEDISLFTYLFGSNNEFNRVESVE